MIVEICELEIPVPAPTVDPVKEWWAIPVDNRAWLLGQMQHADGVKGITLACSHLRYGLPSTLDALDALRAPEHHAVLHWLERVGRGAEGAGQKHIIHTAREALKYWRRQKMDGYPDAS